MIIVTGGAGFIGSAIIAALNKRNINDIIVVDNLESDQKWKNLPALDYLDYIEKNRLLEMIEDDLLDFKIDAIFHLGACSSTTETNASFLAENNYLYTKLLAEYAFDNDIRFIYASSAATYGDGTQGFVDDESKIQKLRPLNMYGYSKQMFDLWARRNGFFDKIAGLKYFNVFGPNEYHKADMKSFILKSYEQINSTGKVKLFKSHHPDYTDGQQQRDFLYIKDAVDMTLFFFDNPEVSGLFNIGTGTARSWNDLVKATFAASNVPCNIEYIDMPLSIRNQYQYFTQADISKIKKAGYNKPLTTLENAVTDYITNYIQPAKYLSADNF